MLGRRAGVELRRLGCLVGQGFHFAPPLDAGAFADLLEAGACSSIDAALSVKDSRAAAA